MDYMEIFLKCIEGDIDTSKASELIRQQADVLLLSGKVKEYEKAVLCYPVSSVQYWKNKWK